MDYSKYQLFICILCQLTGSVLLLTKEWEDGAWTANVNMPLEQASAVSGANMVRHPPPPKTQQAIFNTEYFLASADNLKILNPPLLYRLINYSVKGHKCQKDGTQPVVLLVTLKEYGCFRSISSSERS